MKLGIQMYSLGNEQREDFEGTLKKIKEFGYDGIELCGFAGHKKEEVKKMLDDIGLEAPSAHTGMPTEEPFDSFFESYADIGVKYLIIPCLDAYTSWFPKFYFDKTIERLNKLSECARKYGIRVGFHNHFGEFTEVFGKTIMDQIFEKTPDDFIMEIDTCWAEFGSNDDAYKIVRKYAPKSTEICHFKQLFARDFPNPETMKGGCVDLKAVADVIKKYNNNCWAIVEQEGMDGVTPFECAKINSEFMKTIL